MSISAWMAWTKFNKITSNLCQKTYYRKLLSWKSFCSSNKMIFPDITFPMLYITVHYSRFLDCILWWRVISYLSNGNFSISKGKSNKLHVVHIQKQLTWNLRVWSACVKFTWNCSRELRQAINKLVITIIVAIMLWIAKFWKWRSYIMFQT